MKLMLMLMKLNVNELNDSIIEEVLINVHLFQILFFN